MKLSTTVTSNGVKAFKLIGKSKGPSILIVAGVHGDEFEPMIAASQLIKKLSKHLIKGSVTIVPVANEGAFKIGHRCGADKLDLARTFPGNKRGKITERTAASISQLIQETDYLIDLHTGGTLFDILPLSGFLLHRKKNVLDKQRKMAAAFNLPLIWGTDAGAVGRTLSEARDCDVPAIYAECRGGLRINKNSISLLEKGCINLLANMGVIDQELPPVALTKTWLEDYRPGEGNLQSKLPSPASGVFIPSVGIGKKVKKGSLLGYVFDPLLQKETKVFIEEDGLLFMVRISSKVNVGDTLGGILPVNINSKKTIHAR